MRFLAAAFAACVLGGCVTTGGGSTLLVNTDPQGALVAIDGAGECESPCTVKLDGPRRARIAKAGFVALDVMLTPNRRSVTIPLELAAASDDVDTETLPELD